LDNVAIQAYLTTAAIDLKRLARYSFPLRLPAPCRNAKTSPIAVLVKQMATMGAYPGPKGLNTAAQGNALGQLI
jgi:hypothetical protein